MAFPTATDAAELPVDELAMRLLRHFAQDATRCSRFHVANERIWGETTADRQVRWTATLHGGEAWDWLNHHGLVAIKPGPLNAIGSGYVTERGHAAARDVRGLARMQAEARIDVALHSLLQRRIRRQFLLGEYELAVFAAMREVEIRVRDLAGYGPELLGVDLMRKAFHPDNGPLRDPEQVSGERQATSDLYAGAVGVFKNPSSHRQVDFGDPTIASEAVLLADLLLRTLDSVEERLPRS